jgi:caffeoyl-CoA O-methyltransferase
VSGTASRAIADPELAAYALAHSTPPPEPLVRMAAATRAFSRVPEMMIDDVEGRLLSLLVAISGARRVLEIGTFTGYSALWMATAMPSDGQLVTLEQRSDHAAKASELLAAAGVGNRVSVLTGPALESLASLEGPFDLAFIDADKTGYPAYFEAVVPLMRPGGLIVADNVLRYGRVLGTAGPDDGTAAIRLFNDMVAAHPRVEVVMLTVRDGVSLIRVRG